MGILVASVVLGMHLLTQNGCPWGTKYSKCMAFLVNFDKTCPGDMFCQTLNPYYFFSSNFFFASQSLQAFF